MWMKPSARFSHASAMMNSFFTLLTLSELVPLIWRRSRLRALGLLSLVFSQSRLDGLGHVSSWPLLHDLLCPLHDSLSCGA
jgi:hypothetical protein